MSLSTITAFDYIPENSAATPGLWNRIFSQLSDNIGTLNAAGIPPAVLSSSTYAAINIVADSSTGSDYLRFADSSGQRSTYRIGSFAGGTADGLNIYDESGQTMIASFSKQSIRFYQNVVGPVFDVGGALASTLNAGTFGTATDSDETRIQAAIIQAAQQGIERVYVPSSMYPYSASSISFIHTVQMVREGGSFGDFDIVAYGADPLGVESADSALQGTIDAVSSQGTVSPGGRVTIPPGRFSLTTTATILQNKHVSFLGAGRASALVWAGGNNQRMLQYVGGGGSPDAKAFVEKVGFVVGAQTGVVAITSGSATTSFGMQNLTVRDCTFQNVDSCFEGITETDEIVFEDNWVLAYYGAAVKATGNGNNSNWHILHNHFQGGYPGSWAIDHTGGSNINIMGNTIQSGTSMGGSRLSGVADFTVRGTYYESSPALAAADGPFLSLIGCTNGVIEANHTTGDTGNYCVVADGTTTNLRVGPNRHGVSGGAPISFLHVLSGASNIWVVGKQDCVAGAFTSAISGAVNLYAADEIINAYKPVNQFNGFVSVGSPDSKNLFTLPEQSAYIVYMKSGADSIYGTAIATRTATGGAAFTKIQESNAALVFAVFGNAIGCTSTIGVTRTIEYSGFRIF